MSFDRRTLILRGGGVSRSQPVSFLFTKTQHVIYPTAVKLGRSKCSSISLQQPANSYQ
jgi:hypothetical protein